MHLREHVALRRRHDAVDQTHFERGLSQKRLAQQQCFCGAVITKHLRSQQARARFGAHAQIHEGHRERSVVARVDQIAMEQHGRTDADCRAAHRCQQGLGEGGQQAQETEDRCLLGSGRTLQEIADVVARTEDRHVALEHHHAHRCIGIRRFERIAKLRVHRGGQGVFLVHTVERERSDTLFGVNQDVLCRCRRRHKKVSEYE